MLRIVLLIAVGLVVGCGSSTEEVELPPGVGRAELGSTLDQIAKTGEFDTVLLGLTIGLEQEGLMQEAAMVQQIPDLGDEARVKRFAKQVSAAVKRELANHQSSK